jgi:hypothetical protein
MKSGAAHAGYSREIVLVLSNQRGLAGRKNAGLPRAGKFRMASFFSPVDCA